MIFVKLVHQMNFQEFYLRTLNIFDDIKYFPLENNKLHFRPDCLFKFIYIFFIHVIKYETLYSFVFGNM